MRERDLDIRIAEELFGLKGVGYYGPTIAHGMHQDYKLMSREDAYKAFVELWPEDSQPNNVEGVDLCHWGENWGPLNVDEYSTEIMDAWNIVRKISEELCDFSLEKSGGNWTASWPGFTATDTTPERAICLAALEYCKAKVNSSGER